MAEHVMQAKVSLLPHCHQQLPLAGLSRAATHNLSLLAPFPRAAAQESCYSRRDRCRQHRRFPPPLITAGFFPPWDAAVAVPGVPAGGAGTRGCQGWARRTAGASSAFPPCSTALSGPAQTLRGTLFQGTVPDARESLSPRQTSSLLCQQPRCFTSPTCSLHAPLWCPLYTAPWFPCTS